MKWSLKKYAFYEASVMDAAVDVRVIRRIYREIFRREPRVYREDFCGTFLHSAQWVRMHPDHRAVAIDRSSKPLLYGKKFHYGALTPDQKERLTILQQDVRQSTPVKADLISALNFSYCFFKDRSTLLQYFKNAYRSLNPSGLLLLDAVGGSAMQGPSTDKHRMMLNRKPFFYYWEQKNFDPITNEARFAIHFQIPPSKRIRRNVFVYDWRMWSIPELKEALSDSGFKAVHVYWEGTARNGEGNGTFRRKEHERNVDVWIAYLAGVKKK